MVKQPDARKALTFAMSTNQKAEPKAKPYVRGIALTLLLLTLVGLIYSLCSIVFWKVSVHRGLANVKAICQSLKLNSDRLSGDRESAIGEPVTLNAVPPRFVNPSLSVLSYEVISLEFPAGDSAPIVAARLRRPLISVERCGLCRGGIIGFGDGHARLYCSPDFERVVAGEEKMERED
jgi:hypothetical protein